jgi:putative ABC transport system substrate-binding protein
MRRRDFITLVGGVMAPPLVWALAAHAQQRLPVIGFLNSGSLDTLGNSLTAFRKGLRETGFTEGQNVAIEYRLADGQYDRLPALAADLVHRQVDVIAANGPAALPAKSATTTIPIVFRIGGDPIRLGLVASLNRPGGNLTGVSALSAELGPKRLELLHELVPTSTSAALLVNPANSSVAEPLVRTLQAAAGTLGLQLTALHASTEPDIEAAFAAAVRLRAGGLVIGNDAFFTSRSKQIAALAIRHLLPTIYQFREFAEAGGLLSYGDSVTDQYRLFGVYTGRVLKGEKPADLPVQQSTKIELIINLKTAAALGLTVPPALLARADEVIE